jgi:hypothetical protein
MTLLGQQNSGATLISVQPERDSQGVDPAAPVVFTFNVPMKRQQAVMWMSGTGLIDTNRVVYAWSSDSRTLSASMSGGWPSNQEIQWILMPTVEGFPPFFPGIEGFEDTNGNGLEGDVEGSFRTRTAGNSGPSTQTFTNSCGQVTTQFRKTSFSITLTSSHAQTGPDTLIPMAMAGADSPFQFLAMVTLEGAAVATNGSLRLPSGAIQPLESFPMSPVLFHSASSTNLASLLARFPEGNYRFTLQGASGIPSTVDVALPSASVPMIRVSNYAMAQSVDASRDFVLTWNPLGGRIQDTVRVELIDEAGNLNFASPDVGCPGSLNGTSTSFTIPGNSLKTGARYQTRILLSLHASTTEINDTARSSRFYSVLTEMPLLTQAGLGPLPPVLVGLPRIDGENLFIGCSQCVSGGTYRLESSPTLMGPWTPQTEQTASGPNLEFKTLLPSVTQSLFRVVSR